MPKRTFEKWEKGGGSVTAPLETHYMTLPGDIDDTIRQLVGTGAELKTHKLHDVFKPDAETVELVYYNDLDAEVQNESYDGSKNWTVSGTRLDDSVRQRLQELLQTFWGPAWLVGYKPDKRENWNSNRQRLWVRRVTHTDFRYSGESYGDARKMIEGIDVDADKYGELDFYPEPPGNIVSYWTDGDEKSPPENQPLDIYVHRTKSGTAHLLRGRGFRGTHITDDAECLCGASVPSEAVREGEVFHFADYVERFKDGFPDDMDPFTFDVGLSDGKIGAGQSNNPAQILREDACKSCLKDYSDVKRSGYSDRIRSYQTPYALYTRLDDWTFRADDLDWDPSPTEAQLEEFGGVDQ